MLDRKICSATLVAMMVLMGVHGQVASAQDVAGQRIKEVEFSGLETLTADTLEFYLAVQVGEAYDPGEVNKRVHRLWGRQLIDDISITAELIDGGVRLTIEVVERPTMRSIEYTGLKRISRSDVNERIGKDRIKVREGDPVNLGELYRLKRTIEEMYGEKGYRLAEAKFSIESASFTDRKVFFTIDEGDKVRVEDIDFEGNTVYRDVRLRLAMKKTKQSGMITKILKKDVYSPASLDEDLDRVREVYRKAGYKNVVLGDPHIEVKAMKPGADKESGQKRRLFITIPVEEGDRWKLGKVTIEGNERFSDELMMRVFPKAKGGWLGSKVVEEGVKAINELYQNTGHLFARVEPEIVEREDQVADIIVHVDEGEQFRIGKIEFTGNTSTRDKVIRREMGIQEGLVLNSGALRNSLLRIRQMEFFRVDEEDPVAFEFNEEEKTVDLTLKGEEGDRTELLFGAGFSEIDGFFGQIQFKTRNFLGRGETLGVSLQSGNRQDIFDISYFVPWFLDKPQNVGAQLFKRRLNYNLLDGQRVFQDNQGGVLTYGRNLGLFRNLSLSYSLFDSTDERTQFDFNGDLVTQSADRRISSLRLTLSKDRRDSRLQPTVGKRWILGIEYAGGILGGTTNYVRPTATYTKYLPVTKEKFRSSLAFNVRAGIIEAFGDEDLFYTDRFFLGGENSIRGFRYRSIWVRDPEGVTITDEFGFPMGGELMNQVNLEYIVVLGGPFRFILFGDGGKVFLVEQGFNFDNLRATAGAELQINVPMLGAPLRFIFSKNLSPLADDRFQSFQFSIGPSF